jgi:DNA-binding response OmpR family regulator
MAHERVLLIEDDPSIVAGLELNLSLEGYEVVSAADGESGLKVARERPPDVVLLDIMLPGMNGLEVLRRLRKSDADVPVLILTARGEEADKVLGLQLGADDYVVKPFSVHELAARILAVQRRAEQPSTPLQLGAATIDLAAHSVRRGADTFRLLPKEAELLAWLLRHRGQTQTRDELLRAVWGYDATPTTRTVDTHVFQLRQKVERDPAQPEWLLTVHGRGYRLRE